MDAENRNAEIGAAEVQFAVAESYKTIRTNLLFLLAENPGCKIITVSSPKAGDGKTTNSVNLAIAFSQLGKRVLLIDADLRRPSVCKKLRLENTDGLSGVLAGFIPADKAIVSVNASFDVLPSGAVPPNPAEILASGAMERLLTSLRLIYDYIIIDSSPVGVVSDALVIAPRTDGMILVVKDKETRHSELEKVLDSLKLANIRVLGAVLNASAPEESYSHYNSYY